MMMMKMMAKTQRDVTGGRLLKRYFIFLDLKIFMYVFIFGCCWCLLLLGGLSLVVASGELLFVAVLGLLIAVASLL